MKQEWGREGYAGDWPSDKAVWTIGAFFVALLSMAAICAYRYERVLTPLQRHYLLTYAGTPTAGALRKDGWYTLLAVVTRKDSRLAIDPDVEPVTSASGESTFALTDEAVKTGAVKLEWQRERYDNAKLHELLAHWIYNDQSLTDLARPALWGGLGVFVVGLIVAIPKDAARKRERKLGRRLKGPELVTVAEFNRRNRSDGVGFIQQERSVWERVRGQVHSVNIPRAIESSHIEIMGDSGTGKSALIRQILTQAGERGQSFVYELLFERQDDSGKPMLPGLIEIEKLTGYSYDAKKSGLEGQRSGSSRPQVGGMSGSGRGEESPALARRNGDPKLNLEKYTTRESTEENRVVLVPSIAAKPNGADAAGVK